MQKQCRYSRVGTVCKASSGTPCPVALGSGVIGGWIAAEAAAGPAPASFPHGPLDDAPQPFVPNRPASEADRNHVDAVAMFAAGRADEERQEYDVALRMYQRAFRLAPAARDIAQAVVLWPMSRAARTWRSVI